MTNPYASPEAEVVQAGSSSIDGMPRFSTWMVFFLSIITFGIYGIYWLYSRVGKLNQLTENPVPVSLIHAYLGITIISWICQGMVGAESDSAGLIGVVGLLASIASMIIYWVTIFKMRNRLCDDVLAEPRWNGFFTWFLNLFYINYKVNQAIDARS